LADGVFEGLVWLAAFGMGITFGLLFSAIAFVVFFRRKGSAADRYKEQALSGRVDVYKDARLCFEVDYKGGCAPIGAASVLWLRRISELHKMSCDDEVSEEYDASLILEGEHSELCTNLILDEVSEKDRHEISFMLGQLTDSYIPFDLCVAMNDGKWNRVTGRHDGTKAFIFFETVPDFLEIQQKLQVNLENEKRKNAFLQNLVERLPVPIWSRNKDCELEFVNSSYVYVTGAGNITTAIRQQVEMVDHVDKKISAHRFAQKALLYGELCAEQRSMVVKGERYVFQVNEIPDNKCGVIGYASDITDLICAEQQVTAMESAYITILNNIKVGIASFAKNQKLRFYNAPLLNIWQADKEWLDSQPVYNEILGYLHSKHRIPETTDFMSWKEYILELYKGNSHVKEDVWHLSDKESYRVLAMPDPSGGVVLFFEDVSDQLRIKRRYSSLVVARNATLDGLEEGVVEFGSDGCVKICNPAFVKFWDFDCKPDDLENSPLKELDKVLAKHVPDKDFFTRRFSDLSNINSRKIATGVLNCKGRYLEFKSSPLPAGSVLFTFSDVTSQKRLERALYDRTELLAASDRMKRTFLSRITYRLRTPLSSVLGFSEILRDNIFGALNPQQQEYVQGILTASKDLLQLVDEVFDLVSVESGTMDLQEDEFAVDRIIEDIVALLQTQLYNKCGRVSLRSIDSSIPSIKGDRERLKKALFILISEAADSISSENEVCVSTRFDRDESIVILTISYPVQNNDYMDSISKVFGAERHDSVYDTLYETEKLFLRLTLARKIMELNGGVVQVSGDSGSDDFCMTIKIPVVYGNVGS